MHYSFRPAADCGAGAENRLKPRRIYEQVHDQYVGAGKSHLLAQRRQLHGQPQPVDLDPALALAFAIWMVWSVVVVNLPAIGFSTAPTSCSG
jgi:hypothetical protein